MKYYIATRLPRAADHNVVRDAMAARGHTITHDWTTHGSVRQEGPARMAEVADAMVRAVLDADLVIVLLPGGRGTHAELGMALAAGKPVLLHTEADSALIWSPDETICFYHHRLCLVIEGSLGTVPEAAERWHDAAPTATRPGEAGELEWLTWFAQNADFGPADGDVQVWLRQKFERETGKRVPRGWRYDEEEEDEDTAEHSEEPSP